MGGTVSLIIDILMVGLMAVTIFHCIRLSRRLAALREGRAEMDATIKQFFEASAKADLAIKSFQRNASDTAQKLDGEVTKTKLLIDELKIMIETGNNLALRLEGAVEGGRGAEMSHRTVAPHLPVVSPPGKLQTNDKEQPVGSQIASPATVRNETGKAVDVMPPEEGERGGGRRADGRTKAEQELLKALQNMR
jgi:hypothetical protein